MRLQLAVSELLQMVAELSRVCILFCCCAEQASTSSSLLLIAVAGAGVVLAHTIRHHDCLIAGSCALRIADAHVRQSDRKQAKLPARTPRSL
jgi:hypothetical protein